MSEITSTVGSGLVRGVSGLELGCHQTGTKGEGIRYITQSNGQHAITFDTSHRQANGAEGIHSMDILITPKMCKKYK